MTLKDLLFRSGGIDDFVHRKSMIFDRIDIIRVDDDYKTKKLITINIDKKSVINDLDDGFFDLKENDQVIVYSQEMFEV